MRVRVRRFRRDDQGCPQLSGLIQRPCHWHPMLPIEEALVGYLALAGVIGSNVLSAVECRPSVWPFMAARSRCSCLSGHLSAPGLLFTTTASADFPPGYPVGISLGKNADYSCTTPPFTQTPRIQGFDMLCCLTRTLGLIWCFRLRLEATADKSVLRLLEDRAVAPWRRRASHVYPATAGIPCGFAVAFVFYSATVTSRSWNSCRRN